MFRKKLTYDKLMKGQKVLSYCVIADPPIREPTDYNKLWADFLASDKSEKYKRSIISLLDGGLKDTKKHENTKEHDKKLSEMNKIELREIAKLLKIKYYTIIKKDELTQKIKKLMTDFLESDKRSTLSSLDGGSKDTKEHDKELSEMNKTEPYKIAKSIKIKKDKLIQKRKKSKSFKSNFKKK